MTGATNGPDGWTCYVDDPNAAFIAIFICPKTRNDWKVCIIHRISVVSGSVDTLSGVLSVGVTSEGEFRSATNIFNSINMDLSHPSDYINYYTYSSAFNASEGDWIRVQWMKDDAPAAFAYFYIVLTLTYG